MSIFASDDNDDDLNFEGSTDTPQTSSHSSSLPSRPTPNRKPFGMKEDGENETKPSIPRKPSPFAPQPGNGPSRLPVNPNSGIARPMRENPASSKPAPPFGGTGAAKPAPVPPTTPDLSSYLPQRKEDTSPLPPEEEAKQEPEQLSESELYLRQVKELATTRSETVRNEEERQQEEIHRTEPVVPAPAVTPTPEPEPVEEEPVKKKGFFSAPPKGNQSKNAKSSKQGSKNKPPHENKYDGERKKILYIRLTAGAVAGIIAIAGLQSIFLPDSGPTKEMVMSAAQESVDYTGFPSASGEQFAIDFSKAYFNFDSTAEERAESLERFASADLVKEIDIQILSAQEYESVAKNGQSYSDYKVAQSVSYGPYVVAVNNISEEHAVFTVKVGLKTGTVIYLDVPVKYDPKNYSLTLAGPPSFSKPIQNRGEATKDEWTTTFEGGGDAEIQKSFAADLEAYLSAWALSDSTILNRYILDEATDNAKKGLQGSVRFHSIVQFNVESQTEERPETATQRRVEINVMWEDPKTGLRYPQQYRMLIGLNQEGKWAVYDIENFAVLN